MVIPTLTGPSYPAASGRSPRNLVIFLHGIGADGNDLISLAPYWAKQMPDTEFVSPNAPYVYDMSPQGRQWFSIHEHTEEAMMSGVQDTAPILTNYMEEQLSRTKVPPDRLALVGFSQGTMMGLYVALRHNDRLAGVVGYSGRFIGLGGSRNSVMSKPPVIMVHGDSDELIPASAMLESTQKFASLDVAAQWHICSGLGHSIDQEGLQIGSKFLRDCFTGMA